MAIQVSFEFFPPKTPEMETQLWECVTKLSAYQPRFVSVTYGAGGSTRERTHATVTRIRRDTKLEPAAHLTCVNAHRDEINAIARNYWEHGIRHIVALRGDPSDLAAGGVYTPMAGGYDYAADLVAGLHKIAPFEISVAAYPETHPQAVSAEADMDNLHRKIDAGATRAITQFFFTTALYEKFVERARRRGINVPIVPGILPVTNFAQLRKFAGQCGASIPDWMSAQFEGLDADPDTRRLVAASIAVDQVMELRRLGVDEFHFYTLNRADLVSAICRRLDVTGGGG
ncbi:MAG: methylenetetrahydrofolate reductase [NAD(P)H] [Alphaproteobacteria bacterium]|nr:methylenetetrahydrofolate reductase [NAD(P)H] [Alphaproteobacteria bacterium]